MEFKKSKDIIEILSSHYKSLLFLKLNKQIKFFINSMPLDLKHKLTQDGVICDIFKKRDIFNDNYSYYFRIRTYHPALTMEFKSDYTKNTIKNYIKNYKKYNPNDFYINLIKDDEIIINCNNILKIYKDYEYNNSPSIIIKDIQNCDFKNVANKYTYHLVEQLRESIKKTNAKLKSIKTN
ncbi:hypothetical protein [Campylobacter sp. MG1]|uniref:hypothetical protein n=1 Tax=Campylobacter sp. MG1 TaxID=2976332 RepID=UPI00226CC911|nr:hypothetical protein [Campylobacter sp. MG1]